MADVIWEPTPEVLERANVVRLMRRAGAGDYWELVRRSYEDPGWFWPLAIEDMGIEFSQPRVVPIGGGAPLRVDGRVVGGLGVRGGPVPDDVTSFIAKVIPSNIRELEGALIRVVAYASLTKSPITIDLAAPSNHEDGPNAAPVPEHVHSESAL